MEHDRTTPQSKSTTAPAQPAMTGDDDLLALRAADRYFDFLAAGQTPTGRDDVAPELTSLFTDWRGTIGAAPIPPTPTLDSLLGLSDDIPTPQPAAHNGDAVADDTDGTVVDIRKHPRFSSWRREAVRAVSGAAAFLILAAGGLTIAIQPAGLNDPLWSVNRALFTSNANDIELATYLNQDIDRARSLADSGQDQEALRVLDRVQTKIDGIGAESRRVDVQKRLDATRKEVSGAGDEAQVKGSKKAPHSTPPSERTPSTSVEGKNTDDTSASESTKVSDAESAEDDSSVTEKSTSVTDNPTGSSSSEKSSAGSAHSSHVQSPHPPTVPPLDEPLSLLISLR